MSEESWTDQCPNKLLRLAFAGRSKWPVAILPVREAIVIARIAESPPEAPLASQYPSRRISFDCSEVRLAPLRNKQKVEMC